MKEISIFILTIISFSVFSYSNNIDTLTDKRTNSGLEILYLNKPLTADVIRKANPTPEIILLFSIDLGMITKSLDSLNSVLEGIGETQIVFIINEIRPKTRLTYKEGIVLFTVHWPRNFPLEKGSKILFRTNYRYQDKSGLIKVEELQKEIVF